MNESAPVNATAPMMYVSHAGKTWGPYDMETLLRHVNDCKFSATDLVNVVGSDEWHPLYTFVSFPDAAKKPPVHRRNKKMSQYVPWAILIGFACIILVWLFSSSKEDSAMPEEANHTYDRAVTPKAKSLPPISGFVTHYKSPPDLNDTIIRAKVLAEATEKGELGKLGTEGHGLICYPKGDTPYTGCLISKNHYGGVWIMQCKNGRRHGFARAWNSSWQIRTENHWKDGMLEGAEIRWFESGYKDYECEYVKGKKEGMERSWRRDGSKHYEVNYKNGKKNGVYTLWDKNGGVKTQMTF